jgi:hypothetical protein
MNKPKDDLSKVKFNSKRLEKRLLSTVENLTNHVGASILEASGSRGQAKAAYRMLSNERFSKEEIQRVYAESTINRMGSNSTVLLVQDSTGINLNTRKKTKNLGYVDKYDLGIKIHTCIAVTEDGAVLGILSQKTSTRSQSADKSQNHDAKKLRAVEEKECYRWIEVFNETMKIMPASVNAVTVCDREGDFYELYASAIAQDGKILIRLVQNRLISEDTKKAIEYLRDTPSCGTVVIEIPRDIRRGMKPRKATLEVSYTTLTFKRPKRRTESHLPKEIIVNGVHIVEKDPPADAETIEWFLATNETVSNFDDALRIVRYYVQRWKIERYHYVLKEGCNVEKLQERTLERMESMICILSIIAVYIMALTYLARINPDVTCDALLEESEWKILYCAANAVKDAPHEPYTVKDAVKYLAQLGGFAGAPSDGVPGVKVIWRGIQKLHTLIQYYDFLPQNF